MFIDKSKKPKIIFENLEKGITILSETQKQLRPNILNSMLLLRRTNGPEAVKNNLVKGLVENNIPYNINPRKNKLIYNTIIVLSGIENINLAISIKINNKDKRIFVGPNTFVLPEDYPDLVKNILIDKFLVPSKVVKNAYIKNDNSLRGRIEVWFSGVDLDRWNLKKTKTKRKVLIYQKNAPAKLLHETLKLVKKCEYEPIIVLYGYYSPNEYRSKLASVDFVIFFSNKESQGIAMLEAWSCDKYTFVWNPGLSINRTKRELYNTDSSPYLTSSTGLKWKDIHNLEKAIKTKTFKGKHPRKWVNENLSIKCSIQRLEQIIRNTVEEGK